MAELSIHVKVSAFKLSPTEAEKKLYGVKIWLSVAVIFFFALNMFDDFALYLYMQEDAKRWPGVVDATIVSFDYFSISLGLCIASIDLLITMHKHFAKELQDETRRIKVIFLVLTISYISRGVCYLLVIFKVIKHIEVVYLVMYVFWDIIPLSLIMYYHFNNFKAQEEFLKQEKVEEEQTTAQARRQARRQADSEATGDQNSSRQTESSAVATTEGGTHQPTQSQEEDEDEDEVLIRQLMDERPWWRDSET